MDLFITNGVIVTGDGQTMVEAGTIGIANGVITAVSPGHVANEGTPSIDARGALVLPGLINSHVHGCMLGPSMPSGSLPAARAEVNAQLNRHLLSGTTTVVNVCGLSLPDEIERSHPLEVFTTTAHTPSSLAAARAIDGTGLTPRHLRASAQSALKAGAVGFGEGGGGQTLGGGAQDYRFLPEALMDATGVAVDPRDARTLKELVLGRDLGRKASPDDDRFTALCARLGLLASHDASFIAALIARTVLPSVSKALDGINELVVCSAMTGFPALVHTAPPSVVTVLELARRYPQARLIAAHCNHPSFTPLEAVDTARRLKALGATIEVCTLDVISTRWRNMPENFDALVDHGLVDILSTDYAGGHWDGLLEAIHRMVRRRQMPLVQAISLVTGNVAHQFPRFDDRGLLEVGKRADIVIAARQNPARVRHVIIGGQVVIRDGMPVRAQHPQKPSERAE